MEERKKKLLRDIRGKDMWNKKDKGKPVKAVNQLNCRRQQKKNNLKQAPKSRLKNNNGLK